MIIVTVSILFPVIARVNISRMRVLSLFVDIPNHHVFSLSMKCEYFVSTFNNDEQNGEEEAETDTIRETNEAINSI